MIFSSQQDASINDEYVLNTAEGQFFDRKSIEIKPKQLSKTIIAMANAGGGIIAVGVKDGNFEEPLQSNSKFNDLLQVLIDFINPQPKVFVEVVDIDGSRKVILYHVENSIEKMYERNDGKVFLRVGDEDRELNHQQRQNLMYDKELGTFEDQMCIDFVETDFRMKLLEYYKNRMLYDGDVRDLLVKRSLAKKNEDGKYSYKNSAVLLFSEDPNKYIPSAWVRYVKYDGLYLKPGEEFNVIKDREFFGPIPVLIELVKSFIKGILNEYHYLDIEKGRFQSTLEFPEGAWLEGVVNALVHRSYNRQGKPIIIHHYDNRIEIVNSGPLPANVTVDNIKDVNYSRNPRICRVLAELKYVKELNEGVKRIFSSMEKALLGKPRYKDENSLVTLILQNNVKRHSKTFSEDTRSTIQKKFAVLNDIERKIVIELFQNGKIKSKDLEQVLELSRPTIIKYLNKLEQMNIVKKVGDKRSPTTYYIFA